MVKKTITYFWSVRHQFAKYVFVGGSGLVLDMGTLILFTEVFGFIPLLSVVCNQVIALSYNFLLNKYWSFKNKALPHKQLVRYGILVGLNYVFHVGMMYVFNTVLEFDYRLVRIASIGIAGLWNFFVYKYWVYKVEDVHKSNYPQEID